LTTIRLIGTANCTAYGNAEFDLDLLGAQRSDTLDNSLDYFLLLLGGGELQTLADGRRNSFHVHFEIDHDGFGA
jgi:hypothetical protein